MGLGEDPGTNETLNDCHIDGVAFELRPLHAPNQATSVKLWNISNDEHYQPKAFVSAETGQLDASLAGSAAVASSAAFTAGSTGLGVNLSTSMPGGALGAAGGMTSTGAGGSGAASGASGGAATTAKHGPGSTALTLQHTKTALELNTSLFPTHLSATRLKHFHRLPLKVTLAGYSETRDGPAFSSVRCMLRKFVPTVERPMFSLNFSSNYSSVIVV